MRFEQVNPEKEPRITLFVEPRDCLIYDGAARTFIGDPPLRTARHAVPVVRETLDQPEPPVQRESPDEGSRRKTRTPQRLRERRRLQIHPHPVVTRAMAGRIPPSHQRCVRRERDWRRCVRPLEPHTPRRQRIHSRRLGPRIPIRPNPIRPQRIDRDDQQVAGWGRLCRRLLMSIARS